MTVVPRWSEVEKAAMRVDPELAEEAAEYRRIQEAADEYATDTDIGQLLVDVVLAACEAAGADLQPDDPRLMRLVSKHQWSYTQEVRHMLRTSNCDEPTWSPLRSRVCPCRGCAAYRRSCRAGQPVDWWDECETHNGSLWRSQSEGEPCRRCGR